MNNNHIFRRKKYLASLFAVVLAFSFLGNNAVAQDGDGWEFRITPYLWALGLDGETAVLGQNVPVEADFGDLLDLLNIALAANFEANNGDFFFILDAMYAELEVTADPNAIINPRVDIELIMTDALIGASVSEHFDIYAGLRYMDQDITIVPSMLPTTIGLGDDWSDWVIGVRAHGDVSDKWFFSGRLDSKFTGDSESNWFGQFIFSRRFGSSMHLDLGYRWLLSEYTSGSGLSRFLWNVDQTGLIVGYSWNF